jgi:hypothetical protein
MQNSEAKWRQKAQYWRAVGSQVILGGQNDQVYLINCNLTALLELGFPLAVFDDFSRGRR